MHIESIQTVVVASGSPHASVEVLHGMVKLLCNLTAEVNDVPAGGIFHLSVRTQGETDGHMDTIILTGTAGDLMWLPLRELPPAGTSVLLRLEDGRILSAVADKDRFKLRFKLQPEELRGAVAVGWTPEPTA